MRCSICLARSPEAASHCTSCGARLEERLHQQVWGIYYLLGQIGKWEQSRRFPAASLTELRSEYVLQRDTLKEDLLPPVVRIIEDEPAADPPPPLPEEKPAPPPPPVPKKKPIEKLEAAVKKAAVAPHEPAPVAVRPPKPPFSFKNLFTERNIRWILNLGIFIFSVGLAVFIHTQWKEMAPGLKISILFGASFAAMGAGHYLRGTILKATGTALVMLGAIAVPIDCAALVRFQLVDPAWAPEVGLGGSIFSFLLYLGLARFTSERTFVTFASVAGASVWAFLLRVCGAEWPVILPWLAPAALAGTWLPWRPVRLTAYGILGGAVLLTLGFLAAGSLSPHGGVVALEVAFGSAALGSWLAGRKLMRPAFSWLTVGWLGVMFAVAVTHFRLPFAECGIPLAALGGVLGLGWSRRDLAFMTGSVVAGVLSLTACGFDAGRLAGALLIPAVLHAIYGWSRDHRWHLYGATLLGGMALVAGLRAFELDRLQLPIYLAFYGVGLVALGRFRARNVFHEVGALAAGAAMLLLAVWYGDYYQFKPAPAGQPSQLLGAAISAVCAFAFGPIANRIRSRFVSDMTYGCIGFAYILFLRWIGVPGAWLGLSLAGFGVAYALLEKPISRWLLRPSLFTGVACTMAGTIFALLQWWFWQQYLQSSLTLLLIGAFYLAVARFTPYRWLSHVGIYLATAGWLVGLQLVHAPPITRAFLTFVPAVSALLVAGRIRDLHLGLSTLVVAIGALAFIYVDPAMYSTVNLRIPITASLAAAVVAGAFAFRIPEIRSVDLSLVSGVMGLFVAAAYIFFLKMISTGSTWGALVVLAMTGAMIAAAEILHRTRFGRQAWPLVWVSMIVTGLAALSAHLRGWDAGVHLCVYAVAMALYARAAFVFRNREFAWVASATGIAAVGFAVIRGFLEHGEVQAALTLLPVGAFTLALSYRSSWKWLAHAGIYVLACGWWLTLRALGVEHEVRALAIFLPVAVALMIAARRRDLHPAMACVVVAVSALAFVYPDPDMYLDAALPYTIAISLAAAALAGWFAFSRDVIRGVDVRLMSALAGAFASVGWILFLRLVAWESTWIGPAAFAMSAALAGAGEFLRRRGWTLQAWPLVFVSMVVTLAALALGVFRGFNDGMHVWICLAALAMYTVAGRTFKRVDFSWVGAAAGALGLLGWLYHWQTPWIGVLTFPVAALGLQKREKPLQVLGFLAAAVCPMHAALRLHDIPEAGLVFLGMTALLALTRMRPVSFFTMALAVVVSYGAAPWDSLVAFGGFALYCGMGLVRRNPVFIYGSLVLALLGDFRVTQALPEHAGLWAFPLAFVLLAMAYEVTKRFGREFGWPLLGASFAAAILSSIMAFGNANDRIVIFLADALLFGASAVLFRRPELVYPTSAALVALDMALMLRFGFGQRAVAFQLLTLSLVKIIFVRTLGERLRAYLQPVFIASLVIAAGVLAFGVYHWEAYTARDGGDINLAIWGLLLTALVAGIAGRIRKLPVFLYVAAALLLGGYYLTLHKYAIDILEFYTVPVGIGLLVWSGLALREQRLRTLIESLAATVFFLPSAVQSFIPDKNAHTLAALGLAFAVVLAGMVLKRRVLLLGGTGAFVAEVLGKALHFLIQQDLSFAEWGMIIGGLLILLAAVFESRKARFVREHVEVLATGAKKYLASLK